MQSREVATKKELISIKTNMEKKADKVLPGGVFILVIFNV